MVIRRYANDIVIYCAKEAYVSNDWRYKNQFVILWTLIIFCVSVSVSVLFTSSLHTWPVTPVSSSNYVDTIEHFGRVIYSANKPQIGNILCSTD